MIYFSRRLSANHCTLLKDVKISRSVIQRYENVRRVQTRCIIDSLKLVARQSPPPITTDPDCNLYDGYFYVTPRNYTWQLQCANSYGGNMIVQTTDTTDLGSCISECVNYNRANTPGACVAVTFSGSFSTADTACTQFSSVTDVFLASEEGGESFQGSGIWTL